MIRSQVRRGWKRRAAVSAAAFAVLTAVGGGAWAWMSSRPNIAQNETQAIGALRLLLSAQTEWRQNDRDGNGQADYWSGDLYGMYALRGKGGAPVKAIPEFIAKADRRPMAAGRHVPYAALPPEAPRPHRGYFYEAMVLDDEGRPYDADGSGRNPSRFAFRAVPAEYGRTGVNSYIVNEEGVLYGRDEGYDGVPTPASMNWPGKDPTVVSPPWRVV